MMLSLTIRNIQGKIWLLGFSRNLCCSIIYHSDAIHNQLLLECTLKPHARIWPLTQRGSDPLITTNQYLSPNMRLSVTY